MDEHSEKLDVFLLTRQAYYLEDVILSKRWVRNCFLTDFPLGEKIA